MKTIDNNNVVHFTCRSFSICCDIKNKHNPKEQINIKLQHPSDRLTKVESHKQWRRNENKKTRNIGVDQLRL